MPRALVVADDLTGATDTAHAFAKRGYRTAVQVDPDGTPPDATVLAVNTDSRYVDPETAADRVGRAIEANDARVVYEKVDSTLRGNVASEVGAAMDRGFDLGLIAPASLAVGRITASGYHLVDGRPLSDTEYADDPNGPRSSRLPTLFEGSDRSVRHLDAGTVAAGPGAVREAAAGTARGTLVTCDVTHDRHLEAIARAGRDIDRRVLYVGSAGLAEHVIVPGEPDREPRRIVGDGGALGIVGSVSERSLEQLAALPGEWVIEFEPGELLSDPESTGREAGRRAAERLEAGEHAVVTAASDRETVDRTLAVGREAGLDEGTIRDRVASALASAARAGFDVVGWRPTASGAPLRAADPAGLFVTGGDVAMAAFDALGVRALSLSGEAIEAGIPLGRLEGGPADGTPVVTKAGGFGGRETAVNCLRYLGGDHE